LTASKRGETSSGFSILWVLFGIGAIIYLIYYWESVNGVTEALGFKEDRALSAMLPPGLQLSPFEDGRSTLYLCDMCRAEIEPDAKTIVLRDSLSGRGPCRHSLTSLQSCLTLRRWSPDDDPFILFYIAGFFHVRMATLCLSLFCIRDRQGFPRGKRMPESTGGRIYHGDPPFPEKPGIFPFDGTFYYMIPVDKSHWNCPAGGREWGGKRRTSVW